MIWTQLPGTTVLQGCPEYSGPEARGTAGTWGGMKMESWKKERPGTPKGLLSVPLGSLRLGLEGCGFLGMGKGALSTQEKGRGLSRSWGFHREDPAEG